MRTLYKVLLTLALLVGLAACMPQRTTTTTYTTTTTVTTPDSTTTTVTELHTTEPWTADTASDHPAPEPTTEPMAEPTTEPTTEPVDPATLYPPCTVEDGSAPGQAFPCYWDAAHQGNGIGRSYVLTGTDDAPSYAAPAVAPDPVR